jgi:hypothetical protein
MRGRLVEVRKQPAKTRLERKRFIIAMIIILLVRCISQLGEDMPFSEIA